MGHFADDIHRDEEVHVSGEAANSLLNRRDFNARVMP